MTTDHGLLNDPPAKRKRGAKLSSAVECENITKSSKTVTLPSGNSGEPEKTKTRHAATTGGAASSEIIPWELYVHIQKALALTDHLKTNKNDRLSRAKLRDTESIIRFRADIFKQAKMLPPGWTYDLANASNLVAASPRPSPLEGIPHSSDPDSVVKPRHCCASRVIDPTEVFPQTTNVPLNEEEKKIWSGFKEFDKTNPGHFEIIITSLEEERSPVEVGNPIVSLVGNFAVAAFNEAIKMYVKKDVDNNLRDFKFVECSYLKMNEVNYYFTIILEAIEEGKAGVYETKVTLGWEDGMKTLNTFVLTDREPLGRRKVVYYQQRTHPGSWSDPEENPYSGLERRDKKSTCRGYDYYTPWGYFGF